MPDRQVHAKKGPCFQEELEEKQRPGIGITSNITMFVRSKSSQENAAVLRTARALTLREAGQATLRVDPSQGQITALRKVMG
jgi:hypothetical protein